MSLRTFLKPKSPLRAKFWIVKHIVSSDRPDWKAIENIALVDHEFYLICRAFTRYKNAETLISGFNDIELELSFKKFCPEMVLDNVFAGQQDILILEPTLPSNFIDNAIKRFLSLYDKDQMLSTLTMPVHTFLHRIWKKAACSEMRPNKQQSGKIVNTLCEEIVLQCRCSKNYLMDIFVFYNHGINRKMNVEIYYTKSMHKLAVRFIRIYFVDIEPLYIRRSPRVLPLDILFDIGTFLSRSDLDVCQLVSKQWYQMIENNRNGFALHSLASAKLVSKGDFFCFGVFDEDESTSNIVDFRERRCNFEVVGSLFYPLLRNSSVHKLYIKRIDMRIVFESFVKGISRCLPTHIRRLVFSAAQVDSLEKVFEFSETILKIKEYEVEVFSEDLFKHILKQPIVHRCDRLVLYEQYHSNREVLFDVINFFSTFPRPSCTFVMRNVVSEERVNDLLSTFIKDFRRSMNASPFSPMLLVLHHQPRDLPSCCVNAIKVNVPDAFVFETPTLSNIYHFENSNANVITFCIGRTIYHPIRRICHIQFGIK